jgi:uncharacterized small protein (DUF1192 family)
LAKAVLEGEVNSLRNMVRELEDRVGYLREENARYKDQVSKQPQPRNDTHLLAKLEQER